MLGITNSGVAGTLRALGATDTNLARVISQAATGKAVATAADAPAAYVNAIRLNSDAQAFAAVNARLGAAEVPALVAGAAIYGITGILKELTATTIEAQSGGTSAAAADIRIQALLAQAASYESDATVNGVNLVAGAVAGEVTMTQIRVPTDPDGNTMTIGALGLSRMNASLAGLGLNNFTPASGGLNISFSSLGVENISTAPPPTQVQLQTSNYDAAETPQFPGESWTFIFTDAATPGAGTDSSTITDAAGNITHEDHTVPVPLAAGYSLDDAVSALRQALFAADFETQFGASSFGPTLSIAGNNVGTVADPVQNLRPTLPIPIGVGSAPMTAAVNAPPATTQITIGKPSLPAGEPPSALAGASFLSTQAEIDAYENSNPTTAAFYFLPPTLGAAIAPGTTIQSVAQATPTTYTLTLSSPGVTAGLPISTIQILLPLPSIPLASPSPWEGVAGAIATLNSALRKAGDIAQTLGDAVNSLRLAQDHATQSIDDLNSGIGDLTDADLGKVSADMTALQIRQQLATQSLALGDQWPRLLLQLFQ